MKLLAWMDERTGLSTAWQEWLRRPLAGGPAWRSVWPSTIVFLLFIQVVTGVVLWMYYSPGAQSAWESVYYLQYHVRGGWLLRAIHYYSAQTMLAVVLAYGLQLVIRGGYRAPREFLFWTVLLMGLMVLALGLTGDLLPWDQNGYWCTHIRTGFLLLLPGIGPWLLKLAAGGTEFGHLTLTRFTALHVGLFPAVLGALVLLHAWLARRHGLEAAAQGQPTSPYWPRQAMRDGLACLAVLVVVVALSLQHGTAVEQRGVELGAPADLSTAYKAARPEWSFRGLYEVRELLPQRLEVVAIFVIPGLLVLLFLAMPWIGRHPLGHCFNVALALGLLGGLGVLYWMSVATDAKDPEYQKALTAARQQAERLRQRISCPPGSRPEIPPGGALVLVRQEARAVELATACVSCHEFSGGQGTLARPQGQMPTAPNLYGFASRRWLAGLLDPKQVAGPNYFGNTKFKKDVMPAFVKDNFADMSENEKKDLAKLIAALSAEAGLKSQAAEDLADVQVIKEGRKLVNTLGCTGCHKFREKGRLGDAPDLTGYGSRPWLVGIINDPAHKRFYGKKNDRMPAYAPSSNPADNLLSPADVGILAAWLGEQDAGK